MKKTELFFMHINSFIEYMKTELKSDKTIETYINGLNSFRKYLTEQLNMNIEKITFNDIDDNIIRSYLKYAMDNGSSLATRNIKLVSIKEYIRYCAHHDIALVPLQLSVSKIKTKKVIPKQHNWITKEQVELLLKQPSRNRTGIRDRFIILFLFSTGTRLNEMLECRISDIHLNNKDPYIVVTGKGNKRRVIPLTNEIRENMKIYIDLFHQNSSPEDYLIYTIHDSRKHKMSQDNVQRIIKKYSHMARKIDTDMPELHPHMLRHSFGAILYRSGMSRAEIAKLMGHDQESTTEIYVETDVEMIRETLKRISGQKIEDDYENLSEEEKDKLNKMFYADKSIKN